MKKKEILRLNIDIPSPRIGALQATHIESDLCTGVNVQTKLVRTRSNSP